MGELDFFMNDRMKVLQIIYQHQISVEGNSFCPLNQQDVYKRQILAVMNHDEKVQCYGYYNDCNGVKWLYVVYKNIVGYASSKYLSK